jgi:tryptophanyl-tRNA synthetase
MIVREESSMSSGKKRVLSGMQPSGILHLGNLLGALENWKRLQEQYESYFCVADWHALSTNYADTGKIREYIREMIINWLAVGLDPEKCTLFIQSRVPEHAVLHLLFSMIVPIPWLERNPTYKEQQQELSSRDLTTYGFLGYPVLQAADILIYKAHFVPVGVDQLPHIELTREIARRFNSIYKEIFPVPEALLTEVPKLPGTDGRKMSKSYDNAIYLSDPEPVVREKIRTMVTDPARKRRQDPGNPDVCPVFDYHKIYSSKAVIDRVNRECRTAEIGCIDCKKLMADAMIPRLIPVWDKRKELIDHPDRVVDVIREGTRKAQETARETLEEVREAMKI